MKTVRFSKVVAQAGKPEAHLILMEPAKDRALQAAIKAERVMTVKQEAVGTKTDRGEIGFQPGTSRQFFVFPKSLRAFAGQAVVGIKYELLESAEVPKSQRAAAPQPPKKASAKPPVPARLQVPKPERVANPPKSKVVPFAAAPEEGDEDEQIAELKKQVRHAMAVLEEGKPVAAFNLLKRIVGD